MPAGKATSAVSYALFASKHACRVAHVRDSHHSSNCQCGLQWGATAGTLKGCQAVSSGCWQHAHLHSCNMWYLQLHQLDEDLCYVCSQAAAKAGLVASDNSNSLSIAAAAAELNDGTLAPAVHQRLISASCVQKQISEQLNEFKRRFGELHHHHQQQQRHQHPAAAAAAADADVEAAADSNAEGKTPMAALEPGRKRQKIALTAATTSKPVNGHVRRVADPRSSDDSGVMAADADVRSVSDGDSFDSEALDEAEIDDEGSSGSSSIDLEAEYEAQLRQIDVDQPDQPTRAAQLDDATLAALDKLHNR